MPDDQTDLQDSTARILEAGFSSGRVVQYPATGRWIVKGYHAIRAILTDRTFERLMPGRDLPPDLPPALAAAAQRGIDVQARWMGRWDDTHLRIRAVAAVPLAPRSLSRIKPRMRAKADALLEALIARGQGNLAADFARPFVRDTVLDLMGFEGERHRLLADRCRLDINGYTQMRPGAVLDAGLAQAALLPVFEEMLALPAPEDAIVLRAVQEAIADGRVDLDEATSLLSVLLVAGISTSQEAVEQMLARLVADEPLRAIAAAGGSRFDRLAEECIRLANLNFSTCHISSRDYLLGGTPVPAGSLFIMDYHSANRDPEHFAEPDRLDPERVPDHLTFGVGMFGCIGRHLTQLELVVAAKALLAAFPRLPASCSDGAKPTPPAPQSGFLAAIST